MMLCYDPLTNSSQKHQNQLNVEWYSIFIYVHASKNNKLIDLTNTVKIIGILLDLEILRYHCR